MLDRTALHAVAIATAVAMASSGAVAFEQGNPARLRPDPDQECGDQGTRRGLNQRRNIVDRELDRDIVEAPA